MNNFKMIHETALRDIVDVINSVKDFDQIKWIQTKNNVGSIAKRSSDLILVFPVLVSNALSIKTATILKLLKESALPYCKFFLHPLI